MSPRISIIIPVYNGAETVSKTIDSVFKQSYQDVEVIIMDDRSKDDSVAIIKQSPHYKQFTFIENKSNLGISGSYNKAIRLTHAPLLMFLHHDCSLISPDYLETCMTAMQDDTLGAITGKPTIANIKAIPFIDQMYTVLNFMDILPNASSSLSDTAFVEFKADMIRRETIEKLGLFSSSMSYAGEDQDISSKIRRQGQRVVQHNGITFELGYGGNQDTLYKLFNKQATLGRSQAFLALKYRQDTIRNMSDNRRTRAFHRSYQIFISAYLCLLIAMLITAPQFAQSLVLGLGLLTLFRILFYSYHTLRYGLVKYIALYPIIGFICDFIYGFSFFYGTVRTLANKGV